MSIQPPQPPIGGTSTPASPPKRLANVQALSPRARVALVGGLWVILLAILTLLVRNIGWVASWANGVALTCLSLVGLVIVFSLLAAAVEISIETLTGRYSPRDKKDAG